MNRLKQWSVVIASLAASFLSTTPGAALANESAAAKGVGSYEPYSGFKVASSDKGVLWLRLFTYIRYLNQKGLDPTYTDSFGDTSAIDRRQDIQIQKAIIYFNGWVMSPNLRYLAYVWTTNTSQGLGAQVVVAGNVNYVFNPHLTAGAGIDGLPGARSVEGNFPFWLTADNRLMADEYFRGSYTSGIWAKGNVVDRLKYHVMLGNNLSQLGVDAGQLDNKLNTLAASLVWLPTTGEYGLRGGFGDFDKHQKAATRLAAHISRSTEDRQGQPTTDAFENVQVRLSDGNPIFKPDLFGAGIQVDDVNYHMFCADGGIKYRGLSLEAESYWRWLNGIQGPGTSALAFDEITDHGFQLQASAMVVPELVQVYAGTSKIYGDYGDPWDLRFGVNWTPWRIQVVRWNLEYLHTDRSAVGGTSLPQPVGATGDVVYTSFQLNF